ncbi:thioredoxin domain-containing protein [Candidatus Peregrinibacteria bacterium]|nr:thioredoxin domain-containing protein [Candidatus Peregrinibacteria bacterium]
MKNSTNRIVFWIVVIALIVGSVSVIIYSHKSTSSADVPPVSDSDWTLGNKESDIVLIEYSDFQCPACVSYFDLLKDVVEEFDKHILFVYRHYPLDSIHKNAGFAAAAAEAAGKQGKFWKMYDKLFGNQSDWDYKSKEEAETVFADYAAEIGIDVQKFLKDLYSEEVIEKVERNRQSAVSAEIYYTPAFILNGELIQNPRTLEEFRSLIRTAIEKNT